MLFKKNKQPDKPINHIKAFLELPHGEKLDQLEVANELLIEHKERLNQILKHTAEFEAYLLRYEKNLKNEGFDSENVEKDADSILIKHKKQRNELLETGGHYRGIIHSLEVHVDFF